MKRFNQIALLIVFLFGPVVAHAADWSIGIRAGQSTFDDVEEVCEGGCIIRDDSDSAAGVSVNYGFSDNLGVEVGYIDLGSIEATDFFSGSLLPIVARVNIDADAFYFAGTGTALLSDRWSVTGKLGVSRVGLDATGSVSSSRITREFTTSASSEEAYLAAALNFNVSEAFRISAQFEKIDKLQALTLGASYSF